MEASDCRCPGNKGPPGALLQPKVSLGLGSDGSDETSSEVPKSHKGALSPPFP